MVQAEQHRAKKVVIVGAGFAGVSAARTLLSQSEFPVNVTVLEASSRVGGRACTQEIEGCGKVELGATWFHGIVGNPLYEHAIQLGLMPRHEAEDSKSTWGAMKYVRQNEPSLLGEADAAVVAKARDLYGEAVEASIASSTGVVGDKVRQAFALVTPSCSTSSPLGLCPMPIYGVYNDCNASSSKGYANTIVLA